MHELPLAEEFRAFAADPSSAITGGLLVQQILRADTDVAWSRGELQQLSTAAIGVSGGGEVISFLKAQGFAGADTYYMSENSSLEHVLRTRRGIPITLGLVVIGVAEGLGLVATGINFPQHFLVSIDGVLADPFRMSVIDAEQQQAWLSEQGVSRAQAFPPATPVDIVLRMLNNLRMLAVQRSDHAAALDFSGYQLLLAHDPFPFHVERIDLWLAAGVPDMARHELDHALRLAPNDALKAELAGRRLGLESAPNRLH